MPSSLLMPAPMPLGDAVTRRAFVAGVAAAGLVSCSGEPRFGSGPAPAAGFPRTVEHPAGRTEIPAPPTRVVTATDYDDLDAVLAVGLARSGSPRGWSPT